MIDMGDDTCTVEGCERRRRSPGMAYCSMHYRRWLDHGEVGEAAPRRSMAYNDKPCAVDGCARTALARGYCLMHFKRVQRTGAPGPASPAFVPGQSQNIDDQGYRRRRINGRRYKEHRYVMEQILGRPLLAGENVHHVNGDKLDNRPENLELWSTSQPCGQRVADKVAWARQIIDLYGDMYPPP